MPRHLISDAHEWINEIPTVPVCCLANQQPRERAWNNQRGKKTLLSLTLVRRCEMTLRCRISGSFGAHETPLLVMLFYLFRDVASSRPHGRLVLDLRCVCAASYAGDNVRWGVWLGRHIC